MEQVESISMSSVIASLLLKNEVITYLEIAVICSKLSVMGIYVDEENDNDIDYLFSFIDVEGNVYKIKDGVYYDSLINGVSFMEMLNKLSSEIVNNIINNDVDNVEHDDFRKSVDENRKIKRIEKKVNFANFVFGMF